MKNNIWIRLGCTLNLTDSEIEKVLNGGPDHLKEVILIAVKYGRFQVNGESYIPYSSVETYNEEHGTEYPENDYETLI